MRRNLPPLNAIKAFEAAARHLSFKDAAAELLVTPQAISQQIRVLEDWLQLQVFARQNRTIRLTPAGASFLPVVSRALDDLQTSAAGLVAHREPEILTISSPPTFAIRWLIPRMERFRAALTGLDYRLTTTAELPDLAAGAIDVAIHWKDAGNDRNLRSELIERSDLVPVCSPRLIAEGEIVGPADLLKFPLIRHVGDPGLWSTWFEAAFGHPVETPNGPQFGSDQFIVEAAAIGQGICLLTREQVAGDLETGRLVIPIEKTLAQAGRYYLICPKAREHEESIAAFRDWIFSEVAQDRRDETLRDQVAPISD